MESASDGIAFLTERIDAIERERDALLEKSQRLELLQRSFVEIVAAGDERALITAALRGAWLGLGFSRCLWFRVDESGVGAEFELDGEHVVESEYGGTLPELSSLRRLANGDSDLTTGSAADDDAPLYDTRRRYAAASVRPRAGSPYVLYGDGSSERASAAWSAASLQELATHAAFALDRMRMSTQLEHLAMHDPLTGLFNRRALMERLHAELRTSGRTGASVAYVMIDVDDFKAINDTRGHAAGDAALVTIAGILRSQTRETDIPARFAGDEFSLIMPRTDRLAAEPVVDRVVAALREQGLSASIGIAFTSDAKGAEELMHAADEAVYAAKAAGKNCYRIAGL